jgi:transmembrane sensor
LTSSARTSAEHLEAEAAAWAARLGAGDPHPQGLDAWLAEESRHAGALLRAQAVLALVTQEHDLVQAQSASGEREPTAARVRRRRAGWAVGAAVAAAASVGAFAWFGMPGERYQTQVGEVRSLALSDGSSVSLDASSRIDVAYGQSFRDIRLQSGKALFRAAHSPDRPFRVLIGDVVVTDIGTAFQISEEPGSDRVDVLVTEGSVRVASPSGLTELVAGQRGTFAKADGAGVRIDRRMVAPADIERALAWRDGRLDLAGEPLATAVAEINRYSRLPVRLADPAIAREPIYGSFRLDDAAGFARASAASLGVPVRIASDGIVIGAAQK